MTRCKGHGLDVGVMAGGRRKTLHQHQKQLKNVTEVLRHDYDIMLEYFVQMCAIKG